MGYREIDAVDWSSTAWLTYVAESGSCPPSVRFWESDDERFFNTERRDPYDAIVYNFAINPSKAEKVARTHLKKEPTSRLLAPVNTQSDYWLLQEYKLYSSSGAILATSGLVGAWTVQFQPDVTEATCQGLWCAEYNGFKKILERPVPMQ